MNDQGPSRTDLQGWLTGLEADLTRIQAELDPLLTEQARVNARRKLLLELLESFDGPAAAVGELNGTLSHPLGVVAVGESVRGRVQRQAAEIFRDIQRPIHINELAREFRRRGFEIPGAGEPVNITVHLSGSQEFASPRRGEWTLREYAGRRAAPSRRAT